MLLEPWLGGSHGAWAEGVAEHSTHEVEVVGLADRAWRWRLRSSAAWFAEQVAVRSKPDLLLVSGLIDAASLRGLIGRPIPLVLYMHESQGGYPSGEWDVESVSRNWLSMLAADEVWFNSAYHRDVALEQAEKLQTMMPGEQRTRSVEVLSARSHVVFPGINPVPGRDRSSATDQHASLPPVILWPHRWEHDKNPDVFERALARLHAEGHAFSLVLAGAEGSEPSAVRSRILAEHADRVIAAGPFSSAEYRSLLTASDIVVSCTSHEFFGIAVIEAVTAGCVPVLPRAFSYPEIFGAAFNLYEPGRFGSALVDAVSSFEPGSQPRSDLRRFSWPDRIRDYDDRIGDLVG